MNDVYRDHIIDHYQHPRNFGDLAGADVVVKEANASCGDMLEMAIKWRMANGEWRIGNIKFKSVGCAISTAAGSLLTEAVKGKTVKEVKNFSEKDMMALLGIEVSPTRMKCATLPLRALQKAISQRLATRD